MKIVCKSLITVFAAFVLVACNSDEGSTVSNAGEAASEAVDGTLDSISSALDSVTESAGDMVDSASDDIDTDVINEVDTSAIDEAKAEVDALMK